MSVSAPQYIYPPLDSSPDQLYQGFVSYMQTVIPGWQPYSGELDDWLARAFSSMASTLTVVAADVATQIYRYFGAFLINLPPFAATSAIGTVTVTVQDTTGYTIPAFTTMNFPDGSGQLQGFQTVADLTIAASSSSGTTQIVALNAGVSGNGCSGAGALGSTGVSFITGLNVSAPTSGGQDAEDDTAYLNRLTATLTTLTLSPITVSDFNILAATQQGIGRAYTMGTFNPTDWTISGTLASNENVTVSSTANIPVGAPISGTGISGGTYVTGITSGTVFTISQNATVSSAQTLTISGQLNQGGFVTSWLLDADGSIPSSPTLAAVQAAIQAMCLVNVTYSTLAPTSTTVNVTASVVAWPGVSTSAIQTACSDALAAFLEPTSFGINSAPSQLGVPVVGWLNDNKVRAIVLENQLMNIQGVHYVSSIQINSLSAGTDLTLLGIVPITAPGTMTITVTNG